MPIDTTRWELFNLIDLFDIYKGKSKKDNGEYPLVTCCSTNNGICKNATTTTFVEKVITIATDGQTGAGHCFWQPNKVGVYINVAYGVPKFKFTDNICLFLATVMTKTYTPKYSFGKKLGLSRLLSETVYLPTSNGSVDWEWIESFMSDLAKTITRPPKFLENNESVDTRGWKSFKLVDLFNISKGKDKDELGEYSLITCATTNRGRHKTKYSSTYITNAVTVSGDGAPGVAFWQDKPVGVFTNVNILEPKFKCSNNIGLFLEVVITKSLTPKYAYGKKLGLSRILNESIALPVKDGEPDWVYMEKFIQDLIIK